MIGFGPSKVQPYDTVSLLWGAPTPFILRGEADTDSNEYKVIGDCYVHGLTKGEGMRTWPEAKMIFRRREDRICLV